MRKQKKEDCEPNEQTHNVAVLRGVGCTKDEAKLAIIDALLAQAERERKVNCEDLECMGAEGDQCQTTIDPDNLQRLEGQIKYFPIRRKKCPRKIGWLAELAAKPA